MDRRLTLLLPSLVLLVLSAIGWLAWPPAPRAAQWSWLGLVAAGFGTALALLAGAWLLERTVPSFRHVTRRLERLVRDLRLPAWGTAMAALISGVSEEVFFRGWLLAHVGPWWQALLFMLLHPAGRSGWAYTAYTGAAGLAFGFITLASGSLWPALIAHVLVNLHGLEIGRRGGFPRWSRAAPEHPPRAPATRAGVTPPCAGASRSLPPPRATRGVP